MSTALSAKDLLARGLWFETYGSLGACGSIFGRIIPSGFHGPCRCSSSTDKAMLPSNGDKALRCAGVSVLMFPQLGQQAGFEE